jgi:hypothetical protein
VTHEDFAAELAALKPYAVKPESNQMKLHYANTRPDSPKGKVFQAFAAKGVAAAETVATKLDIAPFRVRKWILVWSGKAQAPKAGKTKAAKAPAKKIAKKIAAKKTVAKKKAGAKKAPAPKAEPAQAAAAA